MKNVFKGYTGTMSAEREKRLVEDSKVCFRKKGRKKKLFQPLKYINTAARTVIKRTLLSDVYNFFLLSSLKENL